MTRSALFIQASTTSAHCPADNPGTPFDPDDEPVPHVTHDVETGLP